MRATEREMDKLTIMYICRVVGYKQSKFGPLDR